MYTLSIILNLHREDNLAEQTIKNLEAILIETYDWDDVELIVILDNSNQRTRDIVVKYKKLFTKIEEVDYKDPALSRNHGVDIATNNFILFADGDDYCSHNILQSLYQVFFQHYQSLASCVLELEQLEEKQHVVVFPQYLIEFPALFRMKYYESNTCIIENNKFIHSYHAKIAVSRTLLKNNLVRENHLSYGFEDWDLNNRLLFKGVKYLIANYTLYYRRNNHQSILSNHLSNKYIVRNSPVYAYHALESDSKVVSDSAQKSKIFNKIPQSNILKKINELSLLVEEETLHTVETSVKEFIFKKDKLFLEQYNETVSYREDITVTSTQHLYLTLSIQVMIYNQLLEFLKEQEIIYFLPWVGLGGADKVSIEYIKAVPNKRICAITTINSGARIGKINIPHLDLCSELQGWSDITEDEQLHILVKAIINSDIKLIHVVNSDIALKSIKFYSKVYQEYGIKTMVSLFCPDYDWVNDEYHGYPIMYPELFKYSDIILSDNNYWYDFFKKLNKDNDFNYKKLAVPVEKIPISYHEKSNTKKILWASRICNQKLFGVLEEIINKLPMYTFILYGGAPEEPQNIEIFERVKLKENVEIRGEYQHISEIDFNEFDLFLFTSMFEGLPNMILEAIMTAIPIVSAEVGGISEALGKQYPLLVKEHKDADAYIEKINLFYQNKETVVSDMLGIRKNIIDTHNDKIFKKEYLNIIDRLEK